LVTGEAHYITDDGPDCLFNVTAVRKQHLQEVPMPIGQYWKTNLSNADNYITSFNESTRLRLILQNAIAVEPLTIKLNSYSGIRNKMSTSRFPGTMPPGRMLNSVGFDAIWGRTPSRFRLVLVETDLTSLPS
jgi:hypothetical protein